MIRNSRFDSIVTLNTILGGNCVLYIIGMKQVFMVILIVNKARLFSNLLFTFCPVDPRAEFVIDYDSD